MKFNLVNFVYRALLTGMPPLIYNSINLNTLNVPMTVSPESTYVNFKLNANDIEYLTSYIRNYSDLSLIPVKMYPHSDKEYLLSLNVYNCTSSAFFNNNQDVTRFEINTYVRDKEGNKGTLILDYMSNGISMDPVNLFKWANNNTLFIKKPLYNIINCSSKEDDIYFVSSYYNNNDNNDIKLGNKLIEYTDKVYYKNGIYDKVYYDSTLTEAKIKKPYAYSGFFKYKDLNFTDIHSIFYFEKKINFIGGMWDNVFNL
mgnify:CR=1 FL=1